MSIFCEKHSFVWALLVASLIGHGDVCLSKDQETVGMFDKQVSQLEELWKTGESHQYYVEATRIAADVNGSSVVSTTDRNKILTRLFEALLSKANEVPKTSTDDLFTMQKVASHLLSNANVFDDDRRVTVQLLSRYLGEIRKEIVRDYERKAVILNVSPPPGVSGMVFSGMDPEAIRDPDGRAKYKAAIRENQENNSANTRQVVLRNIDGEVRESIMAYMIAAFETEGSSSALAAECIKNARLTEKERKKIESKLGTMNDKKVDPSNQS